jgi:hypothetical protein
MAADATTPRITPTSSRRSAPWSGRSRQAVPCKGIPTSWALRNQ